MRRFVRPLRAGEQVAQRATARLETAPGQRSQIDWGQARIYFPKPDLLSTITEKRGILNVPGGLV